MISHDITIHNPENIQLRTFFYESKEVRSFIDEKGEPHFIAGDVAKLLGYRSTSDATRILDTDEKGVMSVHTLGGPQKLTTLNESGLYSLIFLSRKPEVRNFKKWVTSEVLPSIRKTGNYGKQVDLNDPKQLRALLLSYSDKIERDQPKVQFYDQYINSEGLYNLQNAARALNQSPSIFINALKNGYLFYQGSTLVPYQRYREQGLFLVKSFIVDNIVRYQTYITPKGLEYFSNNNNHLILKDSLSIEEVHYDEVIIR